MAAVHGNVGRRATAVDRKVAFKSVLDNPFKVKWPHVPLNVQNAALASLVTLLVGVAEYHIARQSASRKRKRARHEKVRKEKANARKKRKVDDGRPNIDAASLNVDAHDVGTAEKHANAKSIEVDVTPYDNTETVPLPPPILSHLTFGINAVTKRLEIQSQSLRLRTSVLPYNPPNPAGPASESPHLSHVFVCRADVDPPLLITHLPELVAACNVPSPAKLAPPVHLISLPKNAEHTLSEIIGLRRVSVFALDSTTPSLATLTTLLSSIQPPSAPWLSSTNTSHVPTHIKQLRTTVPRDMRAAKRTRTESRRAVKQLNTDKRKIKDKPGDKTVRGKGTLQKEKKSIKIVASVPSENNLPT